MTKTPRKNSDAKNTPLIIPKAKGDTGFNASQSDPDGSTLFSSLLPLLPVDPVTRYHLRSSYQRKPNIERLRPWQIESLWHALDHADRIDLGLNTFVTIYWHPITIEDMPSRFKRGTNAMAQWCKRRGISLACIYTHENPLGRLNSHLMLHMPKRHLTDFKAAAPAWFNDEPGGVQVKPVWFPAGAVRYMTKGTDFLTAGMHGGHAMRQGTIKFKRAGWSESLGQKAQADYWAWRASADTD